MIKISFGFVSVITAMCIAVSGPARGAEPATAKRLPVPPAESIVKARILIRDAYESDYSAAKQSGEPTSLLDKLSDSADKESDAIKKYSFFLEAEDVAIEHDDAATAVAVVDRRARAFDIDGFEARATTLARLATPKVTPDLDLFEQARDTAASAAAAERFDIAVAAATLAIDVARAVDRARKAATRPRPPRTPMAGEVVPAANGEAMIKSALDAHERVTRHKDFFADFQKAKTILDTQPDDPSANAKVGTYLCFVARRWDDGMPHLKKSGLATLGELAAAELSLENLATADSAKVFSVAGKWWDAADAKTLADDDRTAIREHASRLYAAVRAELTDPLEIRVAETRGGSTSATPAERRVWLNTETDNVFIYDPSEKLWKEGNHKEGLVFSFTQAASTPEYIEIFDARRGLRMRLHDKKVTFWWGPHGDWLLFKRSGKWISYEEYRALGYPFVPK